MESLIAIAQTIPVKGKVDENIDNHIQLIRKAAGKNTDLILFPELSLTGYEREIAKELAFCTGDYRLDPLREISAKQKIIIVAGAPILLGDLLHIGLFILHPDGSEDIYTKRFLHDGEEKYFNPGKTDPEIIIKGIRFRFAICADINHPEHPKDACSNRADIYAASVFITPSGYENDTENLQRYAANYRMGVLMSNYGGPSGGFESAGKSACWDSSGQLVGSLNVNGEAMLILRIAKSDSGLVLKRESA